MNPFWRTALEAGTRFDRADMTWCVIKSYGGDTNYNDGNVDMLVDRPLREAHSAVLARDFRLSTRDRIKHRLYERNKLMCCPDRTDLAKIHLHRNVGWHNVCFLSAEEVFARSTNRQFAEGAVRIADRDTEAQMFVLHIVFEQFRKNEWDMRFLSGRDFNAFADQYGIPPSVIAPVRDAGPGPLAYSVLRPIWNCYYQRRRHETGISPWNRFLHWGFTCVQKYRKLKADRQSP